MSDKPALVAKPLAQIVTFWRPGSHDWGWVDEYADARNQAARTAATLAVCTSPVAASSSK